MPEAKVRSRVGGAGRRECGEGERGLKVPPTLPSPHKDINLAYLPPCRFHSTDVLSGSCCQLFRTFLGLRWQGRMAELPSLAHTFCSLLSPSATPGSMWPAVRRWRVEQRVRLMEQYLAIFSGLRRAQILPSRPVRDQVTPRPSLPSYFALPDTFSPSYH